MKHRLFFIGLAALLFLYLVGAFVVVRPTQAANLIVTNNSDSGVGSLRQAVADANPGDVITFASQVSGTITLNSGQLVINKSLTITGPGAANLAISGNNASRVISITTGVNVTLLGLTIYGGNPGFAGTFYELVGGGISNSGTLTLTHVTLTGNTSPNGGGAFYNGGTLVVSGSTVLGNSAIYNGVIFNNGLLTVTASTISGNQAAGGGPGAYSSGGIVNQGTLALVNSTLSGNSSTTAALNNNPGALYQHSGTADLNNVTIISNTSAGSVGGIMQVGGILSLRNTIVAGNSSASAADISGTVTSQGYNLIQSTTGYTLTGVLTGVVTGTAPLLGPLENNGGSTLTHALLTGSPAVNAGNPVTPGSGGNACEATDQRGVARPQGMRCDMGAYEYSPSLTDLDGDG